MPAKHHVVVDGSNLATEGRTLPSLAQLDEAVRAYVEEDPEAEIVVVVDASFEHRIDASERAQLEEAELHGEIVSPPAGAIGRGDAFVLRIAQRTGALVLSNDSFQEFHGEHPWLFEDGRLIGGKPVPGVGWIFTPRSPVRGAKSRQATGKAKRAGTDLSPPAPVKAAELAKAAKRVAAKRAATRPDGTKPRVGDVWEPEAEVAVVRVAKKAKAPKADAKDKKAEKAEKPAKTTKTAKSSKAAKATKAAKTAKTTKAPKTTKTAKTTKAAKAAKATKAAKTKADKTTKAAKAPTKAVKKAAPAPTQAAAGPATRPRAARGRVDKELLMAIDQATAEAISPPPPEAKAARAKGSDGKSSGKAKGAKRRRRTTAPPPAVNEPLAFITFVASFPIGSSVRGEVASFTSHGAMVEVALPEGGVLHCYIPLAGLGRPAPTKAREVLTRGERRDFELVSLDPPRRVAELALPGLGAPAGNGSAR